MKRLLRAFRRKRVWMPTVAALIVAGGLAWVLSSGDGDHQAGTATQGDGGGQEVKERSASELSAEMEILRKGVEDNRRGTNDATTAINEIHLLMDGQAEQVAALLQDQQSVNPAVLEVQLERLAQTVEEMSLILGQTRRQTQEITEIGGAVASLQRRLQTVAAEVEAEREYRKGLEEQIIHNQVVSRQNAELLADPSIFVKPELAINWDEIGTPEALGLCRNSQIWAHQPPSVPGQAFDLDMTTQIAMYYRNEMNEGRLTEAQAKALLADCRADIEGTETEGTESEGGDG